MTSEKNKKTSAKTTVLTLLSLLSALILLAGLACMIVGAFRTESAPFAVGLSMLSAGFVGSVITDELLERP